VEIRNNSELLEEKWRKKIWIGLGLFIFSFFSVEFLGRYCFGYVPDISNSDFHIWSAQRQRVDEPNSRKKVVLIGASAIVRGFNDEVFKQEFPDYEYIQLGIVGSYPGATLSDILSIQDFNGIIICDINEFLPFWEDGQGDWVNFYHESWNFSEKINWAIRKHFILNFVTFSPVVNPVNQLYEFLRTGQMGLQSFESIKLDRTRLADFRRPALKRLIEPRKRRFMQLAELGKGLTEQLDPLWIENAMHYEKEIEHLQNRGGKFVYLRLPLNHPEGDDASLYRFKKHRWDKFSAMSKATFVHTLEFPELARFKTVDTVHLDISDTPAFTRALLNILRNKNILSDHNA